MNRNNKILVSIFMASMMCLIVPANMMGHRLGRTESTNNVFGATPIGAGTTTFTGSLTSGTQSTQHTFSVPSGATKISVTLAMPSGADYDLSLWDVNGLRTGGWCSTDHSQKNQIANAVYSGYSASPETITVNPPAVFGTWSVGCYDYSGSGTYTITVDVTVSTADTTAPTVSITAPASGATVSDTITISATASDNVGVSYCAYKIDSGSTHSDSSSPYSWSLDTTTLSDGSHTITVYAYDAAGNSAYATRSITVANDGGETHLVTDTYTGTLTSKGDIDYFAIADVEPGLMSLSVSWSTSYDIDCYIMTTANYASYLARGYTTNNPETCSYTIQTAGTYYIGIRMYSSASSSYTATVSYYTGGGSTPDTTNPNVDITSSGGTIHVSSYTMTWTGSDNVGIDHYSVKKDSGSYTSVGTSTSYTFTGLSNGGHTFYVAAYDAAGNSATDSVSVTVSLPDTTNPTISITAPADGASYVDGDSVLVSWTGSDNVGIDHYTVA